MSQYVFFKPENFFHLAVQILLKNQYFAEASLSKAGSSGVQEQWMGTTRITELLQLMPGNKIATATGGPRVR